MSVNSAPIGAHVTYSRQFRRCGKTDCPACSHGGAGHGPYWYAYWREDGRVRTRYLGRRLPAGIDPGVDPGVDPGPHTADHPPAPARPAISPPALRVRTLGAFQVWRGDSAIPPRAWKRRKAGALFKYLLGSAGYRLHRERATELLWPETSPEAGASYLRVTIHQVRKILDRPPAPSHVRTDGDWIALAPDPDGAPPADWLDAAAFAVAAAAALGGQDIAACRAALSRYGGEYLPDDAYDEWAVGRREELERQHLDVLLHLAGLCAARGNADEATSHLEEALRIDPCHEAAVRLLMRLHGDAGRRVVASRVYHRLAQALKDELALQPEPKTQAVYRSLAHAQPAPRGESAGYGSAPAAHGQPPTNLPAPLTSFVGREQAIADIVALLADGGPGRRLLTLIGAGGCGKTRLALEVAAAMHGQQPAGQQPHPYADGVWVAELAATVAGETTVIAPVARVVAAALGLREEPGRPLLATLVDFLRPRHMLLVLDNCEHLIGPCAELVTLLLQACPRLQILATSREALDVPGEIWWRVPSLDCPHLQSDNTMRHGAEEPAPLRVEAHDDPLRYEAVRLFVERARTRRPGFDATPDEAEVITGICQRLDGIPLAIELAAALLPRLTVREAAARLEDRFRALTGGSRLLLPRHQTLRAAVDWSYALLQTPEQIALCRLSVFAGGWTVEAAEAVTTGDGIARDAVAGLLARLAAASMVVDEEAGRAADGQARYGMLETMRHYAREHLDAGEGTIAARERHWEWCLTLANRAVDAFAGPEQGAWLDRLELEHDNLRAALAWSEEDGATRDGLRLAAALWRFWYVRGHVDEGRRWLERFLARDTTETTPASTDASAPRDAARAKALTGAGNLAFIQGDLAQAAALQRECLALYRALGNTFGIAAALHNLSNVLYRQGELAQAVALLEEALTLQHELGRQDLLEVFLNSLGNALMHQGHYERASALFTESLGLCRASGNAWGSAMVVRNLGLVARARGDLARAAALGEESLALSRRLGSVQDVAVAIGDLGRLACERGDYDQATALHEESLALARQVGDRWGDASALDALGQVALRRGKYVEAARLFVESLELWHEQGGKEGIVQGLEGLAQAHACAARTATAPHGFIHAARLFGIAEAARTAAGAPLPPIARPAHDHAEAMAREGLAPDAWAMRRAEGAAMPLDEAVAYALSAAAAPAAR